MSRYDDQVEVFLAQQAKGKGFNVNILEAGLRKKLTEGSIGQQDVLVAAQVAKTSRTDKARALYSRVKSAAEQAE